MTQTLFLARLDYDSNRWIPIGRLTCAGTSFEFEYVEGARIGQPLASFPELDVRYVSPVLFPVFANRVMSPNRPDFSDYLGFLGLDSTTANPMMQLARSGGKRVTDSLRIIPYPDGCPGGVYETHFFVSDDEFSVSGISVAPHLRSEIEKIGASPELSVVRTNPPPAPSEMRYLCRLRMPWPIGFKPFSGPEYQSIATADRAELEPA